MATYYGTYRGISIYKNGQEFLAEPSWKGEQLHGTSLEVIMQLIDDGGIYVDQLGNTHYLNEEERL